MNAVYRPLPLRLGLQSWALFTTRSNDSRFSPFRDRVFLRDHNTCQFCGFQATLYQTVVNLDANYSHNVLSNMVTACCFCAQCCFIEMVGKLEYGDGVLIYCPEMTQNEVNGLCHVAFCAMANSSAYSAESESIYNTMKLRSKSVDKRLGERMSQPKHLAQMLIDTPLNNREQIAYEVLSELRLLPLHSAYKQQIQSWGDVAIEGMMQESPS